MALFIGRLGFAIFLLFTHSSLKAESMSTPGAIALLQPPADTHFEYDPVNDLSIMTRGRQTRFTLSVLPQTEASFALEKILLEFDAGEYVSLIEPDKIAGRVAAGVHARRQTSDWWIVVKQPEMNLFVRVQDTGDAKARRAELEALVKSVQLAPASHPALVSGDYTTGSSYSDSYGSEPSVSGESSISLQADGSFTTSSFVGVSGADVSAYSQGPGAGGWWQVRGNRILAFEPPETFYNFRFEAFSNGLELYDNSDQKLLWVRR